MAMAETSALCFSRFRFPSSLASISRSTLSSPLSPLFSSSFNFSSSRSSRHHIVVKATDDSSNLSGDDPFRSFPWFQSDSEIQWVHEDRITLFTADGLVQIGGSITPRHVSSSDKQQGKFKTSQKQRFQESNYMDPEQGLCLGALFDIAATNVIMAEKEVKGDLHEKLTMTVAVPLLWGVPPASETLHLAVKSGGGIVEKAYWQWYFL
ncbi:uncharacterized protein [Arachis hypogaea]|uniref:uncharacterized protein isoform X2 n=1 Tax=Arachis hypogaea TaxID=3818 RepID=UPI000DEC6E09|nr:uncharacterized protein LOC112728946 isoform X2 [Arachis hypogaea]XP_025663878.1 uncharacterized protein LOC112760104 isoform X2 [Arachis hypogaea]